MTDDFKVLGVDHITITAPEDLQSEVLDWYRDCLGLDELTKPEGLRPGGAWFRAGDQEIHVDIDEHNPHKAAHLSLVVDDFDAAVSKLRAAASHIEQAATIPGRQRCYTRDPAGNRVEILYFEEPDAQVTYEEIPEDAE